jgi:hypothetical protein
LVKKQFTKIKVLNKSRILLILYLLCLILFVSPRISFAQSVLFSDDFENDSLDLWTVVKGDWSVQNIQSSNRFGLVLNGMSNTAEVQIGSDSWSNYELSVDMLPIQGWDRNLFFRVGNERSSISNLDLPTGYALHMSPNWVDLQKWTPGVVNHPDLTRVEVNWENEITRHFRIVLKDNNIKVFSNNIDEIPSTSPIIDYTDDSINPILSGKVALVVTTGADFPSEVWFDNLFVIDIPTIPTFPNLDVPYLSQSDPSWANEIYDSANKWSSSPYVSHWGCALTSASMVLNFYGYETTPKNLNEWLKSQTDGYLENGLLNWLALSRFSVLHKTSNLPVLEYRRFGNNKDDLISELRNGFPPILKEPGHFIVAKSQLASSFGINDPSSFNRTTLDFYKNTFLSMNSFRPTHTDLSYILITIDPMHTLQVYDSDGNEILNNTYLEEGLIDDSGLSQEVGKSIRIFQLPTPLKDIYHVKVSGQTGRYSLRFYAYDTYGNVNMFPKSGIIYNNEHDLLTLTFGDVSAISRVITLEIFKNDIIALRAHKEISAKYFNLLQRHVNFISWLTTKSKVIYARIHLRNLYFMVKCLTPKFISKNSSVLLLEDIKTLLNTTS